MIHGDFRLDNILLADRIEESLVVDWQTIAYGAVLDDVAYFLGCALPTDVR
jgi:aminoglycoside phosphotransferase (APT) family kinase protein